MIIIFKIIILDVIKLQKPGSGTLNEVFSLSAFTSQTLIAPCLQRLEKNFKMSLWFCTLTKLNFPLQCDRKEEMPEMK